MLLLPLLLACGTAPQVACPQGTHQVRSPGPEAPAWWTLSADAQEVMGLQEAWRFPAWHSPTAADAVTWCSTADGRPRGPFRQEVAPGDDRVTGWVEGRFNEDGALDGPLTGGWDPSRPEARALEGAYAAGKRVGTWTFTNPPGSPVLVAATGAFEEGWPHGPWAVKSSERSLELRYVHGTAHGGYTEKNASGKEIRGHLFNGARNYEWDIFEPDPSTGAQVLVKEEAWKYGTFVVAWDPRAQANPIPGIPIPNADLGPNAEGMCKVHATCASNAFFTALLAGGTLDEARLRSLPILTDYGQGIVRPAPDARHVVVNSYHIDDMQAPDDTHARGTVTFETLCVVGGPQDPIEPLRGSQTLSYDLVYADDVWKLARPLPQSFVRLDVLLKHLKAKDPTFAEAVFQACNPNKRAE